MNRADIGILIVDDVELNRAMLCEMLREQYTVFEAENGLEALETIEKYGHSISLVLLDIIMPVLDGFGLLEAMSDKNYLDNIPVILITSETSDISIQKGYDMGAVDIITKPFIPSIVLKRVRNIAQLHEYKMDLDEVVNKRIEEMKRQSNFIRQNSTQMIDILSTIVEFRNPETVAHNYNIRTFTSMILTELSKNHSEYNLSEYIIEIISDAAVMHDIGNICIPEGIFNKPESLTTEEFEIMKTHTTKGCEIISKLSDLETLPNFKYCYDICLNHHERWDGSGYPNGLVGNQIPIWAQAVALADVYDVLISKRIYRDAYTSEEAVDMILNSECGVFNPHIIESFINIVPRLKQLYNHTQYEYSYYDIDFSYNKKKEKENNYGISARTLRLLELERQKYRIMSEISEEILFEYNTDEDKLVFSEKYQIITGKDTIIKNFSRNICKSRIVSKDDKIKLFDNINKLTPSNLSFKLEMQINLTGKGFEWFEVYFYSIWDMDEYENRASSYIGKLINIEQRKRKSLQLQKAATIDPLTGVLNRSAIKNYIIDILSDKTTLKAAVCFIDIDNFKNVNDNYGHLFGDKVLNNVTDILKSCTRKTDLVGRIGGDEFIVFLRNIVSDDDLEKKVASICYSLRQSFDGCNVSGSIGVSKYPDDGEDYQTLIHKADQALYLSKNLGKDGFQFYNDECKKMPFRSIMSDDNDDSYDSDKESYEQDDAALKMKL